MDLEDELSVVKELEHCGALLDEYSSVVDSMAAALVVTRRWCLRPKYRRLAREMLDLLPRSSQTTS